MSEGERTGRQADGEAAAGAIEPLLPAESVSLERDELQRFIALLESLDIDAWAKPVSRPDWTVHALVAHVTGGYAAQAHFVEMRRQTAPRVVRFYRMQGESLAETIARIHIGDRRHRSPVRLIAELREVGPAAIDRRARLFRPLQVVGRVVGDAIRLPAVPLGPFRSVRDLWLHRFDIAESTGTPFDLDRDHDGRIVAELMRIMANRCGAAIGERAVDLAISGPAGGRWRFGADGDPCASIAMEPRVFALLISGRRSPAGIRERSTVEGDVKLAMSLLTAIHPGRR